MDGSPAPGKPVCNNCGLPLDPILTACDYHFGCEPAETSNPATSAVAPDQGLKKRQASRSEMPIPERTKSHACRDESCARLRGIGATDEGIHPIAGLKLGPPVSDSVDVKEHALRRPGGRAGSRIRADRRETKPASYPGCGSKALPPGTGSGDDRCLSSSVCCPEVKTTHR